MTLMFQEDKQKKLDELTSDNFSIEKYLENHAKDVDNQKEAIVMLDRESDNIDWLLENAKVENFKNYNTFFNEWLNDFYDKFGINSLCDDSKVILDKSILNDELNLDFKYENQHLFFRSLISCRLRFNLKDQNTPLVFSETKWDEIFEQNFINSENSLPDNLNKEYYNSVIKEAFDVMSGIIKAQGKNPELFKEACRLIIHYVNVDQDIELKKQKLNKIKQWIEKNS